MVVESVTKKPMAEAACTMDGAAGMTVGMLVAGLRSGALKMPSFDQNDRVVGASSGDIKSNEAVVMGSVSQGMEWGEDIDVMGEWDCDEMDTDCEDC